MPVRKAKLTRQAFLKTPQEEDSMLDTSGSMGIKLARARQLVSELLKLGRSGIDLSEWLAGMLRKWRVGGSGGRSPPRTEQITFELIEKNRPFKKILVERYGKARFRAEVAERRRAKPAAVIAARLPADANAMLGFLRESASGRLPYYERYVAGDCIA